MKRLAFYDSLIAGGALLLWIAIVLVEVKVRQVWFLQYVFWGSLLFLFVAFPAASFIAIKDRSRYLAAVISFLCLAPAFIIVGVYAVWLFKMAIGGGIS